MLRATFLVLASWGAAPRFAQNGSPKPAPTARPNEPPLNAMFQDHAVFQRDQPIRVYGRASPGVAISVSLGS